MKRCSRSRRACRRREDDHGDPVVENPSSCRTAPAATRARRDLHAVRCRLQPRSAQELQRVDTAPLRQRVVRPRAGSAPRVPQAGRPEPPTRPFTRPAQPATRVSPRSPGATRLAREVCISAVVSASCPRRTFKMIEIRARRVARRALRVPAVLRKEVSWAADWPLMLTSQPTLDAGLVAV